MCEETKEAAIYAGREYKYPECCIQMYARLIEHGLNPAILMDLFYGPDSCETHIRCWRCRDKHEVMPKFPFHKYVNGKDQFRFLIQTLKHNLEVAKKFHLLPVQI
jgi:hypothetical protein